MTLTTTRPTRATKRVGKATRERLFTTAEVLANTPGLSFRMLDYWLRTGTITIAAGGAPGSGRQRMWTASELAGVQTLFNRYAAAKAEIEAIRSGAAWAEQVGPRSLAS